MQFILAKECFCCYSLIPKAKNFNQQKLFGWDNYIHIRAFANIEMLFKKRKITPLTHIALPSKLSSVNLA